jgi:hypothetical protein
MLGAVVGAGILLIIGFGVLYLARLDVRQNIDEYVAGLGLPPSRAEDTRDWMALEFIGGAALTFAIIVLVERLTATGREWLRTLTTLALIGGIVLGLAQTVDGFSNFSPDGVIGEVYPAYFFPLNLAMGMLALAVYVPAVIMVTAGGPRAARAR